MTQNRNTDDLQALLDVLPASVGEAVKLENNHDNLLEIILDLGRVAEARYVSGEVQLGDQEINREQINEVVSFVGDFDDDNRAGLERTLHRISAIRNRRADVVGLTLRVGRAVYGTIDIIEDLVKSGKSLLILGKPGIGKTTMLREAARILSETKRVVIVDTSNEIGGDGDVPHSAVGRARRMQVTMPSLQHEVMIEAVENHNPEVIVIDEIGRELEAMAARTIAERGVQLIGTAHGRTLENLLINPTLADLVGGIESVTLSDEEARRRGTQKTVLERRAPPTFDVLVEIQERNFLVVHSDVSEAVDALVRGRRQNPEIRKRGEGGKISIEKPVSSKSNRPHVEGYRRGNGEEYYSPAGQELHEKGNSRPEYHQGADDASIEAPTLTAVRVFPYGVARNRLMQAAKRLGVPSVIVRSVSEADVLLTLRSHYRNRPQVVLEAENRGMPIYVLRSNTITQIERALAEVFNLTVESYNGGMDHITRQTRTAIESVLNGQNGVDLPPANAAIRRLQHKMARQERLVSHSYGKDPHRHVRIFRE